MSGVVALVPLRVPGAKSRLAPVLDADERTALAREMARDVPGLDLNQNLGRAAAELAHGADTLLVVPADVPCIAPGDVEALLAAHRGGVTLVAARRDGGTNALALTPPDAIPFLFGPQSARRHLEAARQRGIRAASHGLEAFACDIDTPEDLRGLCTDRRGAGHARRYLENSGICARLRGLQGPERPPMMPTGK
jgi:2-phospho-L-lactate guanylyltransferase